MSFIQKNTLNPALDISGTQNQSQDNILSDEQYGFGAPLPSQSGTNCTISNYLNGIVTLTNLTNMSLQSVGNFITITGASNVNNNGTFLIVNFITSTSVDIINSNAVFPELNGSLSWIERFPYRLEDDLNYIRTDRKLIKGTSNWYDIAPTYQRPNSSITNIPTNLSNISGKTTDAVSYNINKSLFGVSVSVSSSYINLVSVNNLKHSDSVNRLGVPCIDTSPFVGDFTSCYVHIVDGSSTGSGLTVLNGIHAGERIFGITNKGSSISPDSVEVLFYSAPPNVDFTITNSPYIWESGQTTVINVLYSYNERLDNLDVNAFKNIPNQGSQSSGGITDSQHKSLRQLIHFINEGPADGFASGAYKEILPAANPFPTSIIWYTDNIKTNKIVEKTIVYNTNKTPNSITWKMYDINNILIATIIDSITYNGVFELSRTRTII